MVPKGIIEGAKGGEGVKLGAGGGPQQRLHAIQVNNSRGLCVLRRILHALMHAKGSHPNLKERRPKHYPGLRCARLCAPETLEP